MSVSIYSGGFKTPPKVKLTSVCVSKIFFKVDLPLLDLVGTKTDYKR